jgi:hypothetical protein
MLKDTNNENNITFKETNKITLNVDENEDIPLYKDLKPTSDKTLFETNLELFTICALIGKYIVKDKKPINKQIVYARYRENESKEEMIILKSIAIAEYGDVNILKDEIAMIDIFEQYARTGIELLHDWYEDKSVDFESKLASVMLDTFNKNKELKPVE